MQTDIRTVLDRAVAIATNGAVSKARPAQVELAEAVAAAFGSRGRLAAEAPTGSGKTLAVMVPAVLAASRGERTVVSTETLGLQSQIVDKDGPAAVQAVEEATGYRSTLAPLKGWSNYTCFGKDTEILTFDGLRRIGELDGQKVKVLDGNGQWTSSEIRSFGVQRIVELEVGVQNGRSWTIETTLEHRWFKSVNVDCDPIEVTTADLRPGDKLEYCGPKNRTLGNMKPSNFGIAHGIVFGDGSRFRSTDGGLHDGAATIQLHGKKKWPLERFFNGTYSVRKHLRGYAEPTVIILGLPSYLKDRPSLTWNTAYLYGWLAGYFAADGSVSYSGSPYIASANLSNLLFVTEVCAHLGIDHGRITCQERITTYSKGKTARLYRLPLAARSLSSSFFLIEEHKRRFEARQDRKTPSRYRVEQARRRHKVLDIRVTNRFETVYCAVVPTTRSFTLAGNILTGNCTLAARAAAGKATGTLKKLVDWALAEAATDGTGDRADCPLDIDDELWDKVSIGPTVCPGQDRCPFGDTCRPAAARRRAAEADIVVVNHSILAMQVVTAAPVVIGGEQLGEIDHLVIDEAHSFAAKVRSHGTARISSRLLVAAARSLEACHGRRHQGATQGLELAKALDAQLSAAAQRFGTDKALGKEAEVFGGLAVAIEAWAARERRGLQVSRGGLLAVAAARGRLDDLSDSLRRADKDGTARWLEPGDGYELSTGVKLSGTRLVVAPVETAGAIAGNLFGSRDDPAHPSVVALSATLPASALPELGIGVKRTVYPSPFEDAYRESLLYVPKLTSSSPAPLDRRGRLVVTAHQDWAEPLVLRLVEANGGSALVLAATTSAGRRYAKALQQAAKGRWAVHSQWEGSQARVVQAWRTDVGSVLVGTRSLMTGVDAPGVTCTLVVVDRVPRAAPNPVDDARRDALGTRLSIDRWAADRYVYVADAALLLSQAAGRLVRASSDRGLVAVLDPRLLKGPSAYPEPTRKALLGALSRFVTKTTDLKEALAFARANRERRDADLAEVG